MASLEVTEKAEEDVADVLLYTLRRFGEAKYWEYSDLIEEAYQTITADPGRGRLRFSVRPRVLGHHIEQPGRNARHIVFYTYDATIDRVTVLRVLHDSMDFGQHLP
jgi:plasmid stabilization system protein ParE